jgi:hypothetical protein
MENYQMPETDFRVHLLEAFWICSAFAPGEEQDNLITHIDRALLGPAEDMKAAFERVSAAMCGEGELEPVEPEDGVVSEAEMATT